MQTVEFGSIARPVPRVGLGCGRLVGRSHLRTSAKVVEAALDLGIRYFDVAPSYGMGTAEEVIGAVVGDAKDVIIATKVGVPRPVFSERKDMIRALAKSVLDLARPLKNVLLSARQARRRPESRPRYDFSAAAVRSSLETSLRHLRRSSVDVFLAHEPHALDLNEDVLAGFEALRGEGLIRAYGVGIGSVSDRWSVFGSIWQSVWPGAAATTYASDMDHIWHGVIRTQMQSASRSSRRPSTMLREALEASPHSIVLVSASTPGRLRQLLDEIPQ